MFSGKYMFLDYLTTEYNDLLETIDIPLMENLTKNTANIKTPTKLLARKLQL